MMDSTSRDKMGQWISRRLQVYLTLGAILWVFSFMQLYSQVYTRYSRKYIRPNAQLEKFEAVKGLSSVLHDELNASLHTNTTQLPKLPTPTLRPFIAGEPTYVLVLAYQRTGSTFFGNVFSRNPGAMYYYEPLDGVFVHLYGTPAGWAVPAEISHDWKGKLRDIPKVEQDMMSETMMGLYTCQHRQLPTAIMGHSFFSTDMFGMEQPRLNPYQKCMGYKSIRSCVITHVCPSRVGKAIEQQKKCQSELEQFRQPRHLDWNISLDRITRRNSNSTVVSGHPLPLEKLDIDHQRALNTTKVNPLWNSHNAFPKGSNESREVERKKLVQYASQWLEGEPVFNYRPQPHIKNSSQQNPHGYYISVNSTEGRARLQIYDECLKRIQSLIKVCYKDIEKPCIKSKLVAVKTVRLDMESVEKLLKHLPNLRVIHLLRDPRAVALSRTNAKWSAGHSAKTDIVKAAALYCEAAAKDVKKRQELESQYPGVFMQVAYEDFTAAPIKTAKEMYTFLNMTLPVPTEKFLDGKNQKMISSMWRDKLTFRVAHDIHQHCKELFSLVQIPKWLTME